MKRTTKGLRRASSASAGTSVSEKPRMATQLTLIGRSLVLALGGVEAGEDAVECVAAGDLGEAGVRQRVE